MTWPGDTEKKSSKPNDVAKVAYESALEFVTAEFASDDRARELFERKTTIEEVTTAVNSIKDAYDKNARRKRVVGTWLHKLSERIVHYGSVLDILAQNHPEYVALAWGSMKFVLMGIINHAELVEEFATALTCIGNVLPEAKLSAELYKTDQIKDAVAGLYVNIMTFLLRAATWYKKHSMRRAFSAIIKPYTLEYQPIVHSIEQQAQVIRRIASGESRSEVREIRTALDQVKEELQGLKDIKCKLDTVIKSSAVHNAIIERVDSSVQDINPRIRDIQLANVVSCLRPPVGPDESLHKSTSLFRRRGRKSGQWALSALLVNDLKRWSSSSGSSLIVLQPVPRAESKAREISVDVINRIRSAERGIFWDLASARVAGPCSSVAAILRRLAFQVIKANPDALLSMPNMLNISSLSAVHSASEWVDLLVLLMTRVGQCFVVVESNELRRLKSDHGQRSHDFVALFHRLADRIQAAGSHTKVLVVNFGATAIRQDEWTGESPRVVTAVKQQNPARIRQRQLKNRVSRLVAHQRRL